MGWPPSGGGAARSGRSPRRTPGARCSRSAPPRARCCPRAPRVRGATPHPSLRRCVGPPRLRRRPRDSLPARRGWFRLRLKLQSPVRVRGELRYCPPGSACSVSSIGLFPRHRYRSHARSAEQQPTGAGCRRRPVQPSALTGVPGACAACAARGGAGFGKPLACLWAVLPGAAAAPAHTRPSQSVGAWRLAGIRLSAGRRMVLALRTACMRRPAKVKQAPCKLRGLHTVCKARRLGRRLQELAELDSWLRL